MAQMCPAKSTIVPFKKQMYSSGSIILSYKDDKCICVSIHAPTRGATFLKLVHFEFSMFQSTHPRGVRLSVSGSINLQIMFQTTHPRGGATLPQGLLAISVNVSIHAPTRGCDMVLLLLQISLICFNPRTHEGVRLRTTSLAWIPQHVSIHAPTRGATSSICIHLKGSLVSIHAPTRGATLSSCLP